MLHGADPRVAELAQYCDGQVIYYADDEHLPLLKTHRDGHGRVAFWREGQLILAQGAQEHAVLSLQRPAVSRLVKSGRLSPHDILVAASAAWALDIQPDLIRAGVKSYGQPTF